MAQAKALFNEKCARCHGEDGRSETRSGSMLGAPNFTDEKWWQEEKTDERLINSVTNGKDAMPAFGKKLSKEEIIELVAYVRHFPKAAH
jgi:mono/diheme cytochrome c family protein